VSCSSPMVNDDNPNLEIILLFESTCQQQFLVFMKQNSPAI
jgi:hypothetical protein